MKGFLAGTVIAVVLLVATILAYDSFQIDSFDGYHPSPYVHVDPSEFEHA